MNNMMFGLTMMVAGMGVTLLTLYILGLVIQLMNRLLPYTEEKEKKGK